MSKTVLAWCLYDLANTLFAMNITSYHFPVWVVSERGGQELWYSLAFGLSTAASALVMPRLGADSDRLLGRVRPMALCTIACVTLTGALGGVRSIWSALFIFAAANFFYQLAGVFYNAMLPHVSVSENMGRISGYGVALGYVGTFIGIVATAPFAARWGRQATFLPTAILFFLLALPSFFIKEKRGSAERPESRQDNVVLEKLRPLLPCSFLGLSVVGVAILFMSVYAKQAVGLSDAELQTFLLVATGVTVAASLLWGRITDRVGGARALGWAWALWVVVFGLAGLSLDKRLFIATGSLSGVALGGTWITSRVMLVEKVGRERVGEAFGLFGLASRAAGVVGPLFWSGIIWAAAPLGPVRYQASMGVLFACALASWCMYRRLIK